jgi:hypothetical protein
MVEPDIQDWSAEEKAEFEKAAIEGIIPAPRYGRRTTLKVQDRNFLSAQNARN